MESDVNNSAPEKITSGCNRRTFVRLRDRF